MAPPLALGEVPEEVRMDKLLGMNAPPAAKIFSEKERYHVEWKDLHMTQEEQDRIAYLRERGAKHVFTPYELEVRSLRSRDLEAYKKPTPLTAQFDRECRYDYKEEGLSFDPRVSTKQSFCSKVFDWCCCICICCCCRSYRARRKRQKAREKEMRKSRESMDDDPRKSRASRGSMDEEPRRKKTKKKRCCLVRCVRWLCCCWCGEDCKGLCGNQPVCRVHPINLH